jgi:Ca2+-binding EF-hand superfamily protein
MSTKSRVSNGNSTELYYVQITEPKSGKFRVFYLYDGIAPEEITNLYRASFESNETPTGFYDETGVLYTPSFLARQPKTFGGKKLLVVNDQATLNHIPQQVPGIGTDSQDSLLTEEQVIKAFEILDLNSDDVVHKEEFIEAMTLAYSNLFELEPGLAFAYTCIGAKDLAIITATACYQNLSPKGTYYLEYDDFCAWYMSIGFDPLRELMIRAIELFSSHRVASMDSSDSPTKPHLMRTKSRSVLNLAQCYHDVKIRAFINQFQTIFLLDFDNINRLLQACIHSGKHSTLIHKQEARTLLLHNLKLHPNVSNNIQNDSSINMLLNILFEVMDPYQTHHYSLGSLLSFVIVCANRDIANNILIFEILFHFYKDSTSDNLVPDLILYNHLLQIFHLIFYYNREYAKVTGCSSDELTHAIYLKLLISVEIKRKEWNKLSLAEFIELFIHGLQLGLNTLQITDGYFNEQLQYMIGYYPENERIFSLNSVLPTPNERRRKGGREAIEAEDWSETDENYGQEKKSEEEPFEFYDNGFIAHPSLDEYDEEHDQGNHEGGRIFKTDTTDLDDQISSFLVGYNGAPITVEEANELLGLHEYSTYELMKYFIQLCNKDGLISVTNFNRGILKLIGDNYISLTVLQRSIVDFILDQLTKIFGLKNSNLEKFSLVDITIALLLYCDDDNYSRSEIILALLKPKTIQFSLVNSVVANLFKACYLLNPMKTIDEIESEAEEDAKRLCMEFYTTTVAPKINPLRSKAAGYPSSPQTTHFTNQQFLKLINFVFTKLENKSELRKDEVEVDQYMHNDGEEERIDLEAIEGAKGGKKKNKKTDKKQKAAASKKEKNENSENDSSVHAFSEDDDNDSDGFHMYLEDEKFPPSSTVLELRAAVSVLGLEHYRADDLIDKLGILSTPGGRLCAEGWSKWFAKVIQDANISAFDVDIAIQLGNKIFAAFQKENEDDISYVDLAIGLSFLCLRSPLEERLMVAFTIADQDSDGFLNFSEFVELIRSTLLIISVCSRLITKKIIALETSIDELAESTAREGLGALGLREDDDITLEMLCDLAEDYLKLASLV